MFNILKTRTAPPTIVIAGRHIGDTIPLRVTVAEYDSEKKYIDGLVSREFITCTEVVEVEEPALAVDLPVVEPEPEPDLRDGGVADPDPEVEHRDLDEKPSLEAAADDPQQDEEPEATEDEPADPEQIHDLSLLDGNVKSLKGYIEIMTADDLPWLLALLEGETAGANRKTAVAAIQEKIEELD